MPASPPQPESVTPAGSRRWADLLARRLLPGGLALIGVVLALQGGDLLPAGLGTIFAAGLVKLGGLLIRLGNSSQTDREQEDAARAFFARTGRWPDEPAEPGHTDH